MTGCVPTARIDVCKNAFPDPSSVSLPRIVVPSLKVTLPVGVPVAAVTVTVKKTVWPNLDGLGELARVAVAPAAFTV